MIKIHKTWSLKKQLFLTVKMCVIVILLSKSCGGCIYFENEKIEVLFDGKQQQMTLKEIVISMCQERKIDVKIIKINSFESSFENMGYDEEFSSPDFRDYIYLLSGYGDIINSYPSLIALSSSSHKKCQDAFKEGKSVKRVLEDPGQKMIFGKKEDSFQTKESGRELTAQNLSLWVETASSFLKEESGNLLKKIEFLGLSGKKIASCPANSNVCYVPRRQSKR